MFKQAVNYSEVMSLRMPGITNFYPEEERLKFWIEKGMVFFQQNRGANLIFRKDHDFYRLYYYASDINALLNNLRIGEPCVIDIPGNIITAKETASSLEFADFRKYVVFGMFQNVNCESYARDANLSIDHSKDISEMMEYSFDKYAEQMPGEEEIKWLSQRGEVLSYQRNDRVIGVLIGSVSKRGLIRYYLVKREYRGEGAGSLLIGGYLSGKEHCKVFVISTNRKAIAVYNHFGFMGTTIVNHVLTNLNIKYEAKDN